MYIDDTKEVIRNRKSKKTDNRMAKKGKTNFVEST